MIYRKKLLEMGSKQNNGFKCSNNVLLISMAFQCMDFHKKRPVINRPNNLNYGM